MYRLEKTISDLRRITARQRKTRATALEKSTCGADREYHSALLEIYDDMLSVIDRHALIEAERAQARDVDETSLKKEG